MKKIITAVVAANISLFAFSSTSISLLKGEFDGNSAIYDTADQGDKTTLTVESLTKGKMGDVFFFTDFSTASGGKLFEEENKAWHYSEFSPRLSLSYLADKDLSNSVVKDYFIAGQYNYGSNSNFKASLVGLGADLNVPGFDFFQANLYYRHVGLTIPDASNGFALTDYTRDTYQFSPVYGTHFGSTGISFKGWMDLTGYNYSTQNQLLYTLTKIGGKPVEIGFEHLYYYEFKTDTASDSDVITNSLQAMIKLTW